MEYFPELGLGVVTWEPILFFPSQKARRYSWNLAVTQPDGMVQRLRWRLTITAIKRKYIYVDVPAVHGSLKFLRDTMEYCDDHETNSSYVMYPSKEEYEAEIDTREKEGVVVGYFRDYTMNKIRGHGLSRVTLNTIYRLIQEEKN